MAAREKAAARHEADHGGGEQQTYQIKHGVLPLVTLPSPSSIQRRIGAKRVVAEGRAAARRNHDRRAISPERGRWRSCRSAVAAPEQIQLTRII
jgi:hypothetical protein